MGWTETAVLAELKELGLNEVEKVMKYGDAATVLIDGIEYGAVGIGANEMPTAAARKIFVQLTQGI